MKTPILLLTMLLSVMELEANNLNTGGLSGIYTTYSAYSIGSGSYELGLSVKGEYGQEALHEYGLPGGPKMKDVQLYSQDLYFGLGLTNWMDLALDLPFYVDKIEGFEEDAYGLGDLSASLKIMHPGMKSDSWLRLAYLMRGTFPTGDSSKGYYARDPLYSYVERNNTNGAFTSGGYNLNPMLAWTFDFTRIKSPQPWLIHVNFGMDALFYPSNKQNYPVENSGMVGGLAIEWLASPAWSMFLDFYGKSRLGNITGGPFLEIFAKDLLNLALGTKKTFASGLNLTFAVEGGLSTQENFSLWKTSRGGQPKTYGIQPSPIAGATLTLGFGRVGKHADSDFDGNPNSEDKCPQDAEDYDGYEDEDGCPDLVHKVQVSPPEVDTVVVIQRDTVQIVRNDTIRVSVPDTLQYQTKQDPNKIFGYGKTTFPDINFKTGSDQLTLSSFKTLNDIAQSMKNFPDVNLQVIGFTDNTGSEETNRILSTKRAEAVVKYLVDQGLVRERFKPVGKGKENPVSTNSTASGRLLNRRVEFKREK